MKIEHKGWVCLITDAEVERYRKAQAHWHHGRIKASAWRQIAIRGDAELLRLSLMNVDEEAALGGYWSGGCNVVDHKFTWDDLNDSDFLAALFKHEQVCVMQKAQEMLDHLRAHMVPLRQALAA